MNGDGYRVRVRNESRCCWEKVFCGEEFIYVCVGVGKRGRHTSLAPLRNQQHQFNTSLLLLGMGTTASTATSVGKQRSPHMQHEGRLQNTSTSHTAVPYPATCSPDAPVPSSSDEASLLRSSTLPAPPRRSSSSLYFGFSMLARLPLSTRLAPKRRLSNTS
jgi:hypothetical protein